MISLVIPCFNEELVLPSVYRRITAAAVEWNDDWEVILVDDGSTDGTWARIQSFHFKDEHWHGVRFARNFGHQAAIGAGLEAARGDAAIVLDADMQDPPELIPAMLAQWRNGHDVVYGIRTQRPESWWKRSCYALYYRFLRSISPTRVPNDAGDFCLMDRRVVDALRSCKEQRPFWRGLRSWTGFRQIGIPYTRQKRLAGESQYTFRKLFGLAADGVMAISHAPLAVVRRFSLLATAAVLLLGFWICFGGTTSGTALLWAALFLGCVQLVGMSILGSYLGRIYDEVRRRPRWIVAEQCPNDVERARPVTNLSTPIRLFHDDLTMGA